MTTLPIASFCSADAAPSKTSQSCADVDEQKETEEVITPARISEEISSPDEETVPLPLEPVTPKEHIPDVLPDVLDVYDRGTFRHITNINRAGNVAWDSMDKILARGPIKFVRKYPVTEITHDESEDSNTLDHRTVGELDLRKRDYLGLGSHSHVYCAPLTLPSCGGPTRQVEVAVKLTNSVAYKDMLANEAKIYAKFPCELQESTPSSPPVVPKFFGYYEPSCEFVDSYKCEDGDEEDARMMRTHIRKVLDSLSPILLLEPCGKAVTDEDLPKDASDTIAGLFLRLHNARFIQGSVYPRNVVMQPGPLTCPRLERSYDNPSFRIIDFGRGECYDRETVGADEMLRNEQSQVYLRL